jgi:5-methylcytosine-specific restriction endonuclease McrA
VLPPDQCYHGIVDEEDEIGWIRTTVTSSWEAIAGLISSSINLDDKGPNLRKMAVAWRSRSKKRAAPRELLLPSIDEVEAHIQAQPPKCYYCNRRLFKSVAGKPHMDHCLPISRGGGAETTNLVLSCSSCNRAKGEMTEAEFRALRALVATWEDKGKDLFRRLKLGWFSH